MEIKTNNAYKIAQAVRNYKEILVNDVHNKEMPTTKYCHVCNTKWHVEYRSQASLVESYPH